MKISRMLLALSICSFTIPTHAMKSEKEGRMSWCNRLTVHVAAITVGLAFLTTGFQAHIEEIQRVRSEHNPCLAVRGFHPEFGSFEITPHICDPQHNVSKLRDIVDNTIGEGATIHAQIVACDSYERHQGPIKRVTRTCIDRPEEITSDQIKQSKPKKSKSKTA